MEAENLIRARGLSKSYVAGGQGSLVLDGIDLDIAAGELVVVLGRSGSGKSTLLNLLGAMDVPTGGELSIDGRRIDRLDELDRTLFRRHHVGFVFQAFNLIPTLTAAENLRLPLALNGLDEAPERIEEQLDALGLAGKGERYPDQLSGGEQQRVAIGRALIHAPALVIADEPTGNLDLETGRQVLALLDRMTRATGKTLVMATHSREVMGIADRVLTIHEGRLATAEGA
jgi:putative ABC transport system ATP-binding protein